MDHDLLRDEGASNGEDEAGNDHEVPVDGDRVSAVVIFLGINLNIAGDAGFIILPPLAAILYMSIGRSTAQPGDQDNDDGQSQEQGDGVGQLVASPLAL